MNYSPSRINFFLFGKSFLNVWLDYFRENSILFFHFLFFIIYLFNSIFSSQLYVLSNLIYPLVSGSSSCSFSIHYYMQYFLRYPSFCHPHQMSNPLYCIWWGGHCCLMHYCAPPNLGITRTWIYRLNFAQRRIFSVLRFFKEPEISDSGPPA